MDKVSVVCGREDDSQNLTRAEIDMIFTKCKSAGQRRMDFEVREIRCFDFHFSHS